MLHGYVYTIRRATRQEGVNIAETEERVPSNPLDRASRFFLCTVMVEKVRDIKILPSWPKWLEMYVPESGGFKSSDEWLEEAMHMPYNMGKPLALFKASELYQWAKEQTKARNNAEVKS